MTAAVLASMTAVPVARAIDTALVIDVTSRAFGDVNIGNTSASMSAAITNGGTAPFGPMNIIGGSPPTPEFAGNQNCQGATLAPGGSCMVTYTFSPSEPGPVTDVSSFTISPTANAADGEAFVVILSGNGINPITIAPTMIDFGGIAVGSTTPPLGALLTNTSNSPFGPLNLFGGVPSTPAFGASQNCQGVTLAPGGTCSVSYTFTPSAPGPLGDVSAFTVSATLSQAAGTAFSIGLVGCGQMPEAPCPAAPPAQPAAPPPAAPPPAPPPASPAPPPAAPPAAPPDAAPED